MLCTAETDTLSAKLSGTFCVSRGICICSYAELFILVRQFHYSAEISGVRICRNSRNYAVIDVACRTVERKSVTFMEFLSCESKAFIFFIHLDVTASGNTACTHSACNNSCVRCLASADGKNTLSVFHTFNILRRGFKTYKDNLFALLAFDYGILCGKYYFTCGCTGRCGNTLADNIIFISFFQSFCVKGRMKKHVKALRINLHKSFFFGDHSFVDQIAGNLNSRSGSTFTVTSLEHKQLALLNCKLHILHIAVMVFKSFANFLELRVNVRKNFSHLCNRHRRTNAGNNVFSLCVHEEFAHETFFTGCRITCKRNSCTAVIAHITERHHLYVYGSTP